MKLIQIGDAFYNACNIVKVKPNYKENTLGVFMVNGDTDWVEYPENEIVQGTIIRIRKEMESE